MKKLALFTTAFAVLAMVALAGEHIVNRLQVKEGQNSGIAFVYRGEVTGTSTNFVFDSKNGQASVLYEVNVDGLGSDTCKVYDVWSVTKEMYSTEVVTNFGRVETNYYDNGYEMLAVSNLLYDSSSSTASEYSTIDDGDTVVITTGSTTGCIVRIVGSYDAPVAH